MVDRLDRDYLVPYAHVTPFQSQRISIFVFFGLATEETAIIRPEFARPKGVFPFMCNISAGVFRELGKLGKGKEKTQSSLTSSFKIVFEQQKKVDW